METAPVILEFPFGFAERVRASVTLSLSCFTCLAWTLLFPAVGLVLLVTALAGSGRVEPSEAWLAAALLLYGPLMVLWTSWRGHKAFKDTVAHVYTIDTQGVRSRSAHSETFQDWSTIRSVRIRGSFLLVFFTRQCAHCIPLRFLAPHQIEAISALARAGGVQRVDV